MRRHMGHQLGHLIIWRHKYYQETSNTKQYHSYSIKCDVWSLGVMLYQMLFAILPWIDTKSIVQLLQAI